MLSRTRTCAFDLDRAVREGAFSVAAQVSGPTKTCRVPILERARGRAARP
jgi:hypothetical protein